MAGMWLQRESAGVCSACDPTRSATSEGAYADDDRTLGRVAGALKHVCGRSEGLEAGIWGEENLARERRARAQVGERVLWAKLRMLAIQLLDVTTPDT